jgi:hypothetical protein
MKIKSLKKIILKGYASTITGLGYPMKRLFTGSLFIPNIRISKINKNRACKE